MCQIFNFPSSELTDWEQSSDWRPRRRSGFIGRRILINYKTELQLRGLRGPDLQRIGNRKRDAEQAESVLVVILLGILDFYLHIWFGFTTVLSWDNLGIELENF